MENLSRHSKKIVSLMIMVMTLTIGVCSFSFESDAANTYYVDYAEPSTSDNQGYLAVEFQKPSGERGIDVFFWNLYAVGETGVSAVPTTMSITISSSRVILQPESGSRKSCFVNISKFDSDGKLDVCMQSYSFNSYTYTAYYLSNYTITGITYKGNVGWISDDVQSQFSVVFNSQDSAKKLQALYEQMLISNANDSTIINKLQSIMNSNASIDSKLSQLIELQEEENTWLQKIWTSIQRFFKGDNATDDTKVEEFNSTSKEQSETLNDLNEQNKTDKIDVDSTSNEIDSNIDTEAIGNYGTVLSVFTNNTHIFQYILIVLAVALIAYVLFGKR